MKKSFIDQMGRHIKLPSQPKRIISLVPSQTELLYTLGLQEEVVGITKFCVHPKQWHQSKTHIGGTKQFHLDRIQALQPDLLIGNKEENEQSQIEELAKQYPLWMSDIVTFEDALDMIQRVGELVGKTLEARELIHQIQTAFEQLALFSAQNGPPIRTAYFIWYQPLMLAAADTFIDQLLQKAGFHNVFHNKNRYPEVMEMELRQADPELILLSSEPFPFKEKHRQFFQNICPNAVIKLVDGELFSWYGSRMLHAVPYFLKLHKELA